MVSPSRRGTKGDSADKRLLGRLLQGLYKGWESQVPTKAAPFYSKKRGLTFYDFAPLKYTGWKEYANGVQENFFDNMPPHSSRLTMHKDLQVKRWGNVALTAATIHFYAELKDGSKIDIDGRHTAVWEKSGRKWLVVHDHWSAPLPAT